MTTIELLRDDLKAALPAPWRVDYYPNRRTSSEQVPGMSLLECIYRARPEDPDSVVAFFQDPDDQAMCSEISKNDDAGFQAGLALMDPICEKYDIRIVEEI
jgi:hypothetical protein